MSSTPTPASRSPTSAASLAEWPLLPMTIVSVGPTVDLVPPV